MDVRPANAGELAPVMTVFDAGGLEVAAERVRSGIDAGRVHVAVEDGRVLGALLVGPIDGPGTPEIEAVAVSRARRGQGIGTALVGTAGARYGRLVAAFDPRVRAFWASLGFRIEPADGDSRLRGRLDGPVDRE